MGIEVQKERKTLDSQTSKNGWTGMEHDPHGIKLVNNSTIPVNFTTGGA